MTNQPQDRCRHGRQLRHRAPRRRADRRARRRRDPHLQLQPRGGAGDRRDHRAGRRHGRRPRARPRRQRDVRRLRAERGCRARRPLAAHVVRLPRQQRGLRPDVDVRGYVGGALRPLPPGHAQGPVLPHPDAAAAPRRRRRDRQHDEQLRAAHRGRGRLLGLRHDEGRPRGAHALPGEGAQRARDPRQRGRPRPDPDGVHHRRRRRAVPRGHRLARGPHRARSPRRRG